MVSTVLCKDSLGSFRVHPPGYGPPGLGELGPPEVAQLERSDGSARRRPI